MVLKTPGQNDYCYIQRKLSRKEHNFIFSYNTVSIFERAEYYENKVNGVITIYKYFNILGIIVVSICFPYGIYRNGLVSAIMKLTERRTGVITCLPSDRDYPRLKIKMR